jgi:hypothetical protein
MSNEPKSMAESLAELGEGIEPMFETAKGIRVKMEADGWSPTAAEAAALTWLQGALSMFWASAVGAVR